MSLSIGQILQSNRYRIDALLGQGGMGAVYRAWDMSLNIPVAVKENLDASPEAQKQFGREAHILARLFHLNLPRVTDYFFIPGKGQYLVMDFVEGEDLQAMLNRLGALPEPQVLNWISQICDALAYLHSQSSPIIHRDIKPANIKIRPDGRAILVDFGIAKVYDPHLATTIGAKAVTPGYSPPEQYGGGTTDARSDIYALGATLYHLLTGQQPPESVQRMVASASLPLPRQLNRQISPMAEQAILKAIEVATDRRFQSVDELRAALTQPMHGVVAHPPRSLTKATQSQQTPLPLTMIRPQARQSFPLLWLGLMGGVGVILIILMVSKLITSGAFGNTRPTATSGVVAVATEISGQALTATLRLTAIPEPGGLPDWLQDGDIITLRCLGTAEGPRWLDGRTGDGTVGLVLQPEGYSGTRWQVHVIEDDVIALENLGDIEGPRWLDGRTGNGTVGLAPQLNDYSGTLWRVQKSEYEIIALENLGDIEVPRWLDGRTGDGTVGLAPQIDNYSGTKWQVIQIDSALVQGVGPDRSTDAYQLAMASGWQIAAESLLAQMTTQVTFNTYAGEVDHVTSDDDQMTKHIVGEKERIEVKPNHCAIWWGWGGESTGPRFSAQQDWQLVQGPANAQEGYGMMIRVNGKSQSHYQFGVRDNEQQFDIEYWLQGNAEILQDWKFTDAIRPGQVNQIGVVADDGHFYFLINGIVVAELNDDRTEDGVMGSYFNTCDISNLTIFETDNFELRKSQ